MAFDKIIQDLDTDIKFNTIFMYEIKASNFLGLIFIGGFYE